MIFQRIRQHVGEQNWVAVGVDFLIVMFGIFAGLQVDNWNEARKERALERSYLARLYEDAQHTVERNEDQRLFVVGHAERAGIVLAALSACELPVKQRDEFATGLYQLGKLYPPYMADGTLEELRSTGKLGILRSPEVRRRMDEAIAVYTEFDRIWSQAMARVVPPVNYVDSRIAIRIEEQARGNVAIGWDRLELDFESLCQDRRFYNAVAAVRNYTYDVAAWLAITRDAFESLREALAKALNGG